MTFRLRIMTMVGGALLLAFIGLGYALYALFDTRDHFASFVDNDLAELQSYQEMYANGLQMGQALRNMLLDPANPQAAKNLAKASEEFDAALAAAGGFATASGKTALVQEITDLRQKRKAAMDKVLAAAAGDRAKAVDILNAEETPTWREIRKRLLDTLEASKKNTVETRAGMIREVDMATRVGIVLGVVSLLVAVVLMERLLRNLRRELGGEPAEARAIMHRVAEGDFTTRIEGAPPGSLLAALGDMVGSLRSLIAEIERQAEQLASGAEEISRVAAQIAAGTAQENEAAASMAATIEEFSVSAAHISVSAGETRTDSESAAELSRNGEERVELAAGKIGSIAATVNEAAVRIRALDERAGQVSAIAAAIKDIAGQTNLLALNAAIEAARAGEQGRGFAVVADEVRKLAERTSAATVEIEAMIAGIQGDTAAAVQAMEATTPEVEAGGRLAEEASASLKAIREGAARTLARVHEMADATGEQSSASTVIAQQVEQVARMVEETSTAVQATARTAAGLEGIARVLRTQVERFRV